jgi:haloacetate dehalogenase
MTEFFEGFLAESVAVDGGAVFVCRGGHGPPILLLHGFPETHLMWHTIAPALARRFTVICADLPGYGASRVRLDDRHPRSHSKRAMARDLVTVMGQLGFPAFAVAGHDRGGRVAYRMALDHPSAVRRLAVLDIVPTSQAFDLADARFALAYWPWSLLAQPEPLPEQLILSAPQSIVYAALHHWGSAPDAFRTEVQLEYVKALRDPGIVHAICQEYRAAASLDRVDDADDAAAGRRIQSPTLALWSKDGPLHAWYDHIGGPIGIWRRWADDVTGSAIAGGHFFPEENPQPTVEKLASFLAP